MPSFSIMDCSNSLGFPMPAQAGQRPGTWLPVAGYKLSRVQVIHQNFPFQCSHCAALPDSTTSLPEGRTMVIVHFFTHPANLALLISLLVGYNISWAGLGAEPHWQPYRYNAMYRLSHSLYPACRIKISASFHF